MSQPPTAPTGPGPSIQASLDALIAAALQAHPDFRRLSRRALLERLFGDPSLYYRATDGRGGSFSPRQFQAIIADVLGEGVDGAGLAETFHAAHALRGAQRRRPPSLADIRRNPVRSEPEWTGALLQLLAQHGRPAARPEVTNIQTLIDALVTRPRLAEGELAAYRNAFVLLQVFSRRHAGNLPDTEHALVLLTLFYLTIDFAAQLDDARMLRWLQHDLERRQSELADGPTTGPLYRRIVAYATAQRLTCLAPSQQRSDFPAQLARALDDAVSGLERGVGETGVARDFGALFDGWGGVWFQKIAASLRLVDNRAQYLAILAQRDLALDRINDARPDAGGRTFDAAFEAGVGDDPYMADIVARALLLPTSDRPRGGLPLLPAEAALDRALWHIDLALTDSKPPNAGYNTILAGLHELKAQVLLSAHRARWSSEAVTQYLSARAEAHRLRVRLGMARARNRLVAAEQAAGFPFASERIGPILALQSRPRGVPKDRGASMRPGP